MKLIKIAFLIALFNFVMVGAVVLALKKPKETVVSLSNIPTVVPTTQIEPTIIPTNIPTTKPRVVASSDPFAGILNMAQTKTESPPPTSQKQNESVPTNQTTQPTVAPVVDNRCIITVDGGRYDVSVFRNDHSGGNVFICGSDASASFHGQHPDSFLQKMSKYRI